MAAQIKVNAVVGSHTNVPINVVVQLDNATVETTYAWTILDQPDGATDALSSAVIKNPTFTPKKEGTYLIKLVTNATLPSEQTDKVIVAVRQLKTSEVIPGFVGPFLGMRVPAAGETTEQSTDQVVGEATPDGWAHSVNRDLRILDSRTSDPGVLIGFLSGFGHARGDVLRVIGTSTLKVGLPGAENLPLFDLALATLPENIDEPVFVLEGGVDGNAAPASGDLIRVRAFGLFGPMFGVGSLGATVYVSDTGQISLIPGSQVRPIGVVIRDIVSQDVYFDGGSFPITTPIAAEWTGTRYFAVSYDGGADFQAGFSDVDMATAGTVAIRTLERLKAIFPKFGNGKKAVITVQRRAAGATYRNIANTADDDLDFLNDVYGYDQLLVRGTDTNATAGSVAFANDLADKVFAGGQQVPGTNATGYNPTGVPTANTFTCQLNGGGAPGLAAEPALIGKRIRFDSATTTVALRNACVMIWQNAAASITTSKDLPAVPVLADIFYIEEPGVRVNRVVCRTANPSSVAAPPSFALQGIFIVGFRAQNVTAPAFVFRGKSAQIVVSFCESVSTGFSSLSCSGGGNFNMVETYQDEQLTPVTITPGVGFRTEGGVTIANVYTYTCTSSACIQARWQLLQLTQYSMGGGCFSFLGVLLQGSGQASSSTAIGVSLIGNNGSATIRRFRTTSTFTESISITSSHCTLYGVDITGVGATPCIQIIGIALAISIQDVVGSTGNTLYGLNLNCRDCHIVMGTLAVNTFTGAAGQDIRGCITIGEIFYVHADYARTDLWDAQGNHIQGTAGTLICQPTRLQNDGVANIGQYKIVKITGTNLVQVAQASSAALASNVVGVSQGSFSVAAQGAMHATGGSTWVQFDAAPTAGNIAYLSTATAGNAQHTIPALAGTNQKLRLGRIMRVLGTLGLVAWHPENLSVLADGLA